MPTPVRDLPNVLAELLFAHHAQIIKVVASRFPHLCAGRVEDAVSGAYEVLARAPERFHHALESGGLPWMIGLAITIGCRDARDQIQRHAYRREVSAEECDTYPLRLCSPDLDLALDLKRDIEAILMRAAREGCANRAGPLHLALVEKLETGEEDTALAARHGLRREHVNRAWSQVRREVRGSPRAA